MVSYGIKWNVYAMDCSLLILPSPLQFPQTAVYLPRRNHSISQCWTARMLTILQPLPIPRWYCWQGVLFC